ncbi:MAG: hypothetical protein LBI87_05830, partial [Candidatus Accumulibacter sp.]|nr:hypothetical protein [Accumulibacter sp.]
PVDRKNMKINGFQSLMDLTGCPWLGKRVQPPNSLRPAFGVIPFSEGRFCLRRFAPENTFLDSHFRGNDGNWLAVGSKTLQKIPAFHRAHRG